MLRTPLPASVAMNATVTGPLAEPSGLKAPVTSGVTTGGVASSTRLSVWGVSTLRAASLAQ
jgi:hypothetical protein